jgi:uncharacterized coiled-coil DUF342 family protein
MKTITIDYNLYIKELNEARIEGFDKLPDLKKNLKSLLEKINTTSTNDEFEKSKRKLTEILYSLEKDDKP